MSDSIAVIGSGFASLAAATTLATAGEKVNVYEKNESAGGRARKFETNGFTFDMGPSWYWMPEVFEKYFNRFGKSVSDYYDLVRLSPSYRVYFGKGDFVDVPANKKELFELFESIEKGSAQELDKFLTDAAYKYEVGVNKLVYKPSTSIMEFANAEVIGGALKLNLFSSIAKQIDKQFKNEKLRQILKFPVLFLGAKPENIPSLYSLMNYADLELGTWYPMGGMHKIVEGMVKLAEEKGVEFHYNSPVEKLCLTEKKVSGVQVKGQKIKSKAVIAGADYYHVDKNLLPENKRMYSEKYWDNRVLAPSSLLFYLGLNKRVTNLKHHNLFFDTDFAKHAEEIYDEPQWPSNPLFYVCVPSITDYTVAPEGCENLFVLMPIAPDLSDNEEMRERYFNILLNRLEDITGEQIKNHVTYKRSYCVEDFKSDYNSYKGNAYGLANTLTQTAFLKPKLQNRHLPNLFYTGQLTTPGPGVPPSLISGQVVADFMLNKKL